MLLVILVQEEAAAATPYATLYRDHSLRSDIFTHLYPCSVAIRSCMTAPGTTASGTAANPQILPYTLIPQDLANLRDTKNIMSNAKLFECSDAAIECTTLAVCAYSAASSYEETIIQVSTSMGL